MSTVSFISQMSWTRYGWQPCSEPANPVSTTSLYVTILCDRDGHVFAGFALVLRLWRSCEPSRQTKHICAFPPLDVSRFLGARTVTPFPWWPWRSQAGGQAGVVDDPATAQGSLTAPRALARKSSSYKPQVGTRSRNATPSPHWWQGTPLSSSASSDNWVSDSCSFIWLLSLDYGCYIDKANHMLRFDLICRGSRWFEILT